jgi:hypothetical protein
MFVDTKPEMSDAQFRAARAVVERDGESVIRFVDGSVSTLLAMAKPARAWAVVRFGYEGRTRVVTHAELTGKGRKVYERELARRNAAAEQQRTLDRVLARAAAITPQGPLAAPAAAAEVAELRSIVAKADPLAVITPVGGWPAAHPDSPRNDEIPF